jgi:membrane protease YdiL (CAAX protease family)
MAKVPAKKARKASASAKTPIGKPRKKAAKPAKAARPAAKRAAAATPRKPSAGRTRTTAAAPAEPAWKQEPEGWMPVEEPARLPPIVPLVAPMAVPRPRSTEQFDSATGDWIPVPTPGAAAAAQAPEVAPDAPKKSVAATVWTVILGIDLALLALNLLVAIGIGLVLVFAPDSAQAEDIRQSFEGGDRTSLVLETLLTFTLMGVIPLLWVINTRQKPGEGTKLYLGLHSAGKALLQGLALTPALLVAVAVLSSLYILGTEGPDGFTLEDDENPAVQAIVDNLNLPIAFLIAFCAGVGEEILFRGVLIKRIGVWGQALAFGLMHSLGGYVPQILFATGLGVLFGYLRRRGWSLIALITAHAMYDLVLLLLALAYG